MIDIFLYFYFHFNIDKGLSGNRIFGTALYAEP
jgi:hypothetical protein